MVDKSHVNLHIMLLLTCHLYCGIEKLTWHKVHKLSPFSFSDSYHIASNYKITKYESSEGS